MFVSYSTSDEFSIHTGISLVSLFENNKEEDRIVVYLMDLGIREENKERLLKIAGKYGRELHFLLTDDKKIREFLGEGIPEHYGSLATYARLCAPFLYPAEVHRIMYIDSDMVVCDSLHEVYHLDMGEKIVAAVPEKHEVDYIAGASREEAGIVESHPLYFNAGFLMIDIDNWNKANFSQTIRETAAGLREFTNKDQSILNAAISEAQFYRLPFRYNYPMHRYPRYLIKGWGKHAEPLTPEEVAEADRNPAIVHYKGAQSRPWFKENTSCMAGYYYKYKAMSPYADVPLSSIFDSGKFQNASFFGKAYMKLVYAVFQKRIGYPIFLINQARINATIAKRKRKKK